MIKIFFLKTWSDFKTIQKCNWEIIELKISHKECHIAKAELKVANFKKAEDKYVCIYENDTILFQGIISGFTQTKAHLSDIEILCFSPNFETELKELITFEKLEYLPIFFQNQKFCASDFLENSNKIFYWDKISGKVSLSCYFNGKNTFDIGNNYIKESFVLKQTHLPFNACETLIKVNWLQHLEGSFNLAPYISKAFKDGKIATLTPESLVFEWPKNGHKLGENNKKSGYKVLNSYIRLINHSLTKPIVSNFKNEEKLKTFKISYFKGYLKVFWKYCQPREEEFKLKVQFKDNYKLSNRAYKIPISINLPENEKAVFFETNEGKNLLEYAQKIILAKIKASTRCQEIKFKTTWELAKKITINDAITINAEKFCKEKITGKVKKIEMHAKGLNKIASITIACANFKLINSAIKTPILNNNYIYENLIGNEIESKNKLEGITHSILFGKNLVEKIIVKNSATEQEEIIKNEAKKGIQAIEYAIADFPTVIEINLKDLRTKPVLKRNFEKILTIEQEK